MSRPSRRNSTKPAQDPRRKRNRPPRELPSGLSEVGADKPAAINFALVESVRPPMYQALKYWGKKPHNIWRQFIETYCPRDGVVLDPFAGSAVAGFEAAKAGRRSIVLDLNPLTSFLIEVFGSQFDKERFRAAFDGIYARLIADPTYQMNYLREHSGETYTVFNFNWLDGEISKIAIEIPKKGKIRRKRKVVPAHAEDNKLAKSTSAMEISYWYPTEPFPDSPVIKQKFIRDLGGDGFDRLWTRRNLYLLARILNEILAESDNDLRLQLLFGFVQTVHLTSRMVVPRNPGSKRDFSGSWGRPDYMLRRREMEQNPVEVFRRSCLDKQGVISALRDAKDTLPQPLTINDVVTNAGRLRPRASINYGIVDVADIVDIIPEGSVDFVITDPPYAGLVPYLDLSLVWLVWLRHVDDRFWPDLQSELTIKKGKIDRREYQRRMQAAFRNIHTVLKDSGYLVVTFHHKKLQEWNDFVSAVRLAGFKFDKVTHQYNRRSGESNVANPYGTSGADFYIRCVKHRNVDFTNDQSGLAHFITQKAVEIIASRGEPTPYDFIIAGLLPEMLQAGYMAREQYGKEILRVLEEDLGAGKIFARTRNLDSKAGDYWWFSDPNAHISYPDRALKDRVNETVLGVLRRRGSVRLDDILAELFQMYPNGLTPDPHGIESVLQRYARRSAGKWKLNPDILNDTTMHTEVIRQLVFAGKRANHRVFVGRREQPETCTDGQLLRYHADVSSLAALEGYSAGQLERIEMIDVLWLNKEGSTIESAFEVENSTGFMSAIQRASNMSRRVPKFMVIPDAREPELLGISDPLFLEGFHQNGWQFITYASVARLASYRKVSVSEVAKGAYNLRNRPA